jgi:hypothetical protein
MISANANTGALTDGLHIHMPVGSNSVAYHWIQANWEMIRTLPSRSLQIPKIAPQCENTEQWTVCLQRILREQIGLNWRKRKNGEKFELTPLSMWSKLGIDVSKYITWYCSPHAAQFGIIQKSTKNCTECDGVYR